MTIIECYEYMQDRMNKLSTNSGDNIPKHQFVRAFNAMQDTWVESRAKLNDTNTIRIDELQGITVSTKLVPIKETYFSYVELPEDYYHIKRVTAYLPCAIYAYPQKESDVNRLLSDAFWKPSIEWEETFYTVMDNTVRVYGEFNIPEVELVYYRTPRRVNMTDGDVDINGDLNIDIDPEFNNASLIEILNEVVFLLSGDIKDEFRYQTMGQRTVQNT